MVSLYQELLKWEEDLKVLVYSGDDDGVCGTVGTQEWIWDLGFQARYFSPLLLLVEHRTHSI